MAEIWDVPIGAITTRATISARFGGSKFGGIEPSNKSPNVMVYTDPAKAHLNGYAFDGWGPDGVFYYTGAGPTGDQRFDRGNKAILEHAEQGRALRVFEALPGSGEKHQRYLGEFRVDPDQPYRREDALGTDGVMRTVIVFALVPVEAAEPAAGEEPAAAPETRAHAVVVAPEANTAVEVAVPSRPEMIAERREAELMAALEKRLGALGREVGRMRLSVPGSAAQLLTDTFDITAGVLYEVKASGARPRVREAIGQLLDYRRFLDPAVQCAVVLPEVPAADLIELVRSVGFLLVARSPRGGFVWVGRGGAQTDL